MNERQSPLHRELRALPGRRAPESLKARVLAAVAAEQAKPWWHRAWWTWPLPARWAFTLTVAAAGAGSLFVGIELAGEALAGLSAARAVAEGLWSAARALWTVGGQPLQGLVVLMMGSCAAFGTGLARLTAPRAGHI